MENGKLHQFRVAQGAKKQGSKSEDSPAVSSKDLKKAEQALYEKTPARVNQWPVLVDDRPAALEAKTRNSQPNDVDVSAAERALFGEPQVERSRVLAD